MKIDSLLDRELKDPKFRRLFVREYIEFMRELCDGYCKEILALRREIEELKKRKATNRESGK